MTPSPRWPVWSINKARTMLDAALTYARVGVPVFPVESRGKVPLVPNGFYAATCEQTTIRQWWHSFPDANIGMPTGPPSGCWVLDVDPRHGGLESFARLQHDVEVPLYATLTQFTGGGGVHLCYGMRDDVQLSNAVKFAGYPGLDLRIAGGYIVVAPSRHKSGGLYRWQNGLPLLPFPMVLVERWRAYQQRSVAPPPSTSHRISLGNRKTDPEYWLRCALKYGLPGCRHNYALFLACHLLDDAGMTPEEAKAYMVTYAQQVPQDGNDLFSSEEALSCLGWAARRR